MNEVGFYTLAGAPKTPRDLIAEVQQAEALGIGAAFVSERFNVKEAATSRLDLELPDEGRQGWPAGLDPRARRASLRVPQCSGAIGS